MCKNVGHGSNNYIGTYEKGWKTIFTKNKKINNKYCIDIDSGRMLIIYIANCIE